MLIVRQRRQRGVNKLMRHDPIRRQLIAARRLADLKPQKGGRPGPISLCSALQDSVPVGDRQDQQAWARYRKASVVDASFGDRLGKHNVRQPPMRWDNLCGKGSGIRRRNRQQSESPHRPAAIRTSQSAPCSTSIAVAALYSRILERRGIGSQNAAVAMSLYEEDQVMPGLAGE